MGRRPPRAITDHSALVVLTLSLLAELFQATIPIALVLDNVTHMPLMLFGVSALPRVMSFWLLSFYLAPGLQWWKQWRKIDILLVNGIASCISYVFTLRARAGAQSPPVGLDNPWYAVEIVAHILVLFSLVGHIRVMIKWYPWNRKRIFIYKLMRFYNATFFLCIQLVGGGTALVPSFVLAFFASTLALYYHLFQHVTKREDYLKEYLKEQMHAQFEPLQREEM